MTLDVDTPANVGQRMLKLIEELYPICRSVTGDGVRETLRILAREIPLLVHAEGDLPRQDAECLAYPVTGDAPTDRVELLNELQHALPYIGGSIHVERHGRWRIPSRAHQANASREPCRRSAPSVWFPNG